MQQILEKLSHPFLVLNLLFIAHLALFLTVASRPNSIAPPDHVYNVLGKNFFYPSLIRQARDGAWGIQDTHTTRATPVIYAQLFFVGLGKLAALTNIDPIAMYQLSRVVGGLAVYWAAYWLICIIFPKSWRQPAIIFTLAGETGPLLSKFFSAGKIVPGWDTQVIVDRRFSLPHHSFGEAFALVTLGLFLVTAKRPSLPRLILLFLAASLATTTLPPFMLTMSASLLLAWGLWTIFQKQLRQFLPTFIVLISGIGLTSIFIRYEFAKGLPWTVFTAAEKNWWTPQAAFLQYLSTLSLYLPFFVILIIISIFMWKKWPPATKLYLLLMASWLITPTLLLLLSNKPWFPLAPFRLVDGYGYIPAGIVAAISLREFVKLIRLSQWQKIITAAVLSIFLLASIILTTIYTRQILAAQNNFWSNIYPSTFTWQGILYMDKLPKNSGVMVREYMGEMLPAFGPVRSFIGGAHGFPDWPERQLLAQRFFTGSLSDQEAQKILTENDIDYIFWGPDERSLTQTETLYPNLLQPIFSNSDVTIYKQ